MIPTEYNKIIQANLDGIGPIDWNAAKKAFKIAGFEPETLDIKLREEMLRKVALGARNVALDVAPLHKLAANSEHLRAGSKPQQFLRLVARQYCQLENKGARLPKFSKWVTSLFKDDKELANELAKLGQDVVKLDNDEIDSGLIISCNPVDILRAADTTHYWSCLYDDGGYTDVLPAALEECTGIGVAYVNHQDGRMKGRVFIHAGEDKDGKPCVILANRYGTGINATEVAKRVAAAGYDCYQYSAWGGDNKPPLRFVGCFKKNLHWDTNTWTNGGATYGDLLARAA